MLITALKLKLESIVGAIVSNHIVNNKPHADNALFLQQLTLNDVRVLIPATPLLHCRCDGDGLMCIHQKLFKMHDKC